MREMKVLQFEPQTMQHRDRPNAERHVLDVSVDKTPKLLPWRPTVAADALDGRSTSLEGVPTGLALREEAAQIRDEVAETIQRLRRLLEAYAGEQRRSAI